MVAAGDGIIGEHHVIKWPIAKILIIPRDNTWTPDYNESMPLKTSRSQALTRSNKQGKKATSTKQELVKGEILIRYQHTPALGSSRSLLVFTQPRTRGMCSVLDFWPIDKPYEDNRGGNVQSNSISTDLSWFEPL